MSAPVVLVVEDEINIRELVCLHLGLEGFECDSVGDGREALSRLAERSYDLLVLDLMIPGLDGLTLCKAARRDPRNRDVPILMLTARREESDKVLGLESGADDYLTKPFGVRELVARARALLRRRRPPATAGDPSDVTPSSPADDGPSSKVVVVHNLEVEPARRQVRVDGRHVDLSAQEFTLLHVLASHPGIVFSRQALLAKVWKADTYVTERSVDTLVKRVRRKIEADSTNPRLVLTVWGAGYKMADV